MSQAVMTSSDPEVSLSRPRKIAFYLAVSLSLASMAITGPLLSVPVTGWLPESTLSTLFGEEGLGIHRVHMEGAALLFWLTIIAMVAQYRRPEERVAPVWAAAAGWVVFLPIELTHLVDPYSIVVTVLVVAVLVLHPRRWPATPIRWAPASMAMAAPFAALALVYAYQQIVLQLTAIPTEAHAVVSHYELMAGFAVAMAVSAMAGAGNFPGSSISAWSVGLMAPIFGVFALGHPQMASSVGTAWGIALIAWGIAYLIVVSRTDQLQ